MTITPFTTLRTKLTRHHLLLARLGWLVIGVLVANILLANVPYLAMDIHSEWQVREAWPFASQFFTSSLTFARWLVIWRVLVGLIYLGTGLLLAWRKWQTAVVLLISANLLLLGTFYLVTYDIERIRFPRLLSQMIPNLNGITTMLVLGSMLSLFYLFPDGQFQPRRWRWFAWPIVANAFLWGILFSFPATGRWLEQKLPLLKGDDELGWLYFMGSLLAALGIGLVGQVYRYRWVASAEQRQQTKWALLGLSGLLAVPFATLFLFGLLNVRQTAVQHFVLLHLELLAAALIPLAIAFSVLRYRLWEVDTWINRTLVFGGLTLLVTAVYILIVGLLSNLLQTGSNVPLSVVATGIIAIIFNPLRQRLQLAVNRLMYGERDDPITVLTMLGKRLEETAVPGEMLPTLVATIAQTLKLPYVAIATKQETEFEIITSVGSRYTSTLQTFPLIYQSELIGQLLVAPRQSNETFQGAERRILENVARQAGTAVYAAQLAKDLQRSRERLVTTREEERRRIYRDLHDGLGPQLATLSLKVDAARNHLARNVKQEQETANHLLLELKNDIHHAIGDIRRVVHQLRPPALDQLGLLSALQEFVAQQRGDGRLQMTIYAPETFPPLPAAVEVAAYRIALEAITNTQRHARATKCELTLKFNHGLQLEICDNGVGFAPDAPIGVGLASMRERATELGGTFKVESANGTTIMVWLPLG